MRVLESWVADPLAEFLRRAHEVSQHFVYKRLQNRHSDVFRARLSDSAGYFMESLCVRHRLPWALSR